jgi:hypothetical protein
MTTLSGLLGKAHHSERYAPCLMMDMLHEDAKVFLEGLSGFC